MQPLLQTGREDLLSIPEAARLLRVKTGTLRKWGQMGRIAVVKIGPRLVRIERGELTRILVEGKRPRIDQT